MSTGMDKAESDSLATTAVQEQVSAQAYIVKPTSEEKTIVHIRPANALEDSPPLYSAKLSTKKDPDVKLWLGSDIDAKPIASATVDKPTVTAVLKVHGETIFVGTKPQTGATVIDHPKLGKLTWKVKISGNPGSLWDAHDKQLAKHKTVGLHYSGGPRELTLLQPMDSELFELTLLTVIVSRRLSGIAQENMAIIGAAM